MWTHLTMDREHIVWYADQLYVALSQELHGWNIDTKTSYHHYLCSQHVQSLE